MVITASAKMQPSIVGLDMQNIINPADVYSGCYIRANINFFAYNTNGNKGILDGLPHGSAQSDLSSYVAKLDDEEQKYLKAIKQSEKLCSEIEDRIEQMGNEDEKDVLVYMYIELMRWEDIREKMRISERQVYRIHSDALNKFKTS